MQNLGQYIRSKRRWWTPLKVHWVVGGIVLMITMYQSSGGGTETQKLAASETEIVENFKRRERDEFFEFTHGV